jgi:integrase
MRNVLARVPRHSPSILTNSKRRPWTTDGFGSSFNTAKKQAGLADKDLHFHDLRGTAATKFYIAGLGVRVIAEILALNEDQVVSGSSTRPEREHNLQNSLQNRPPNSAKYWSGRRESNPRMQLGKLPFYH